MTKKDPGYIRDHRKEKESRAWKDSDPRVHKVWTHLKRSATHCSGVHNGNKLIPGDILTSYGAIVSSCSPSGVDLGTIPKDHQFTYNLIRRFVDTKFIPWGYITRRRSANGQGLVLHIVQWLDHQNNPDNNTEGTQREHRGSTDPAQREYRGSTEVLQHSRTPNSELLTPNSELKTQRGNPEGSPPVTSDPSSRKDPPEDPMKRTKPNYDNRRPGKATRIRTLCPTCNRELWMAGDETSWFCWQIPGDNSKDGCGARFPRSMDGKAFGWIDKVGKLQRVGEDHSKPPCPECHAPLKELPVQRDGRRDEDERERWHCFACHCDFFKSEGWRVRDGKLVDMKQERKLQQDAKRLEDLQRAMDGGRTAPGNGSGDGKGLKPVGGILNAVLQKARDKIDQQ